MFTEKMLLPVSLGYAQFLLSQLFSYYAAELKGWALRIKLHLLAWRPGSSFSFYFIITMRTISFSDMRFYIRVQATCNDFK